MTEKEIINDGALIGRRPSDFVVGEATEIPYEVRNPSGDWKPYAPMGEKQFNQKADSMSCVSFSAINSVEMQEKLLTGSAQNYSDRFLAKMSDTMVNGNWLYKVADVLGASKTLGIGLVLESDYPAPAEPWDWNKYHEPIPEPLLSQLKAKARAWLDKWEVRYCWVNITPENIAKHLKHAPLQMVFPNHAVAGVALSFDGKNITYMDTYEPYIKTRPLSDFTDAMKIVLTPKQGTEPMKIVNDNGTYFLVGEKGKMGLNGMDALNFFRSLTDKEEVGSTANIPSKGTFEKTLAIDLD